MEQKIKHLVDPVSGLLLVQVRVELRIEEVHSTPGSSTELRLADCPFCPGYENEAFQELVTHCYPTRTDPGDSDFESVTACKHFFDTDDEGASVLFRGGREELFPILKHP